MRLAGLQRERAAAEAEVDSLGSLLEGLESDLEGFRRKYKDSWEGVTKDATAHETRTASAREALGQTQQAVAAARESLGQRLQDERATAVSLGLSCPFGGVVESDLGALRLAHTQSQLTVQSTDLVQARREHEELVQRQRALEARIAEIDLRLEDVAREVIAGAIVVATTLTRAYLWESLRARTFDSVVLDEASMAPIPALWTAGGSRGTRSRCRRRLQAAASDRDFPASVSQEVARARCLRSCWLHRPTVPPSVHHRLETAVPNAPFHFLRRQ